MLADFAGQVSWRSHLEFSEAEKPVGLFLSNELADALPVRLIEAARGKWMERRIGLGHNGPLEWTLAPVDAELDQAISALPLAAVDGYRTEIGLAARAWMRNAAGALRRGYLVTIDYGFPVTAYYAPERRDGTLTCYREHQRGDNVLDAPGEQDITAHVDFTALARAAEQAGWATLGLVDQQRFLTGILQARGTELEAREVRAFQTLTHPNHLGARFLALVQAEDAPRGLMGLKFARDWQLG
jgi:SAM-dependent MidA family methyltransferase